MDKFASVYAEFDLAIDTVSNTPTPTYVGTDQVDDLTLTPGDDVIDSGAGDDYINAGGGNDTFLWAKGDGNDWFGAGGGADVDTDIIIFTDVASTEVSYAVVEDKHIAVTITETAEVVTFFDQIAGFTEPLDEFRYSDGVTLTFAEVLALAQTEDPNGIPTPTYVGTDQVDDLTLTSGDDVIDSGAGDDYINAGGGNDTFLWTKGDGNDWFGAGGGADVDTDIIIFTDVASTGVSFDVVENNHITVSVAETGEVVTLFDQIAGFEEPLDEFRFADGTSFNFAEVLALAQAEDPNAIPTPTYVGTDQVDDLTLTPGDDVIDSGAGNDYINAGGGNDTFLWAKGDGNDWFGAGGGADVDTDIIIFTDVASTGVSYDVVDDKHITVTIVETGEVVTLFDQIAGFEEPLDEFRYSDGVTLMFDEVLALAQDTPLA